MSIKVVKFGGSSLADAEHFRQVASIVKSDKDRRYVIPSAPGKRFPDDDKVTDMLYRFYELVRSRASAEERSATPASLSRYLSTNVATVILTPDFWSAITVLTLSQPVGNSSS